MALTAHYCITEEGLVVCICSRGETHDESQFDQPKDED